MRRKRIQDSVKQFITKYGAFIVALARLAYDWWNDGGPGQPHG
jgi:hypothetical protein